MKAIEVNGMVVIVATAEESAQLVSAVLQRWSLGCPERDWADELDVAAQKAAGKRDRPRMPR